ncbi:MAG: head-tail connector protein [Pseudomonadota bacterium]
MLAELITPPIVEPFTLADLKDALRIDHSDDDALVMTLGETARRVVERRLSHAVSEQTWRLTLSPPPTATVTLRPGNVISISGVELIYGEEPPVPSTDWSWRRGFPSCFALEAPRTANGDLLNEVQITFIAGRSDVSTTPSDLVQAITLLTAHYYEQREVVSEGRYVPIPVGVESILQTLREVQL